MGLCFLIVGSLYFCGLAFLTFNSCRNSYSMATIIETVIATVIAAVRKKENYCSPYIFLTSSSNSEEKTTPSGQMA